MVSGEMRQQNNQYRALNSANKSSAASKFYKKPQPPKVYKVKPIHFRELVQKLTGAQAELEPKPQTQTQTQTQSRQSNLQLVVPPPLSHQQFSSQYQTRMSFEQGQIEPVDHKPVFGGFEGGTELTLSPNLQAWFSFAMLSPGTASVSQLEQRVGL